MNPISFLIDHVQKSVVSAIRSRTECAHGLDSLTPNLNVRDFDQVRGAGPSMEGTFWIDTHSQWPEICENAAIRAKLIEYISTACKRTLNDVDGKVSNFFMQGLGILIKHAASHPDGPLLTVPELLAGFLPQPKFSREAIIQGLTSPDDMVRMWAYSELLMHSSLAKSCEEQLKLAYANEVVERLKKLAELALNSLQRRG